MTEVFDCPRGASSMFMILLLGFAFECWIGMLGLGAADMLVFYFAAKGVGYTGFIASAGGDGGFGVTVSSFEMPAAAIFSLSERSIRMSG